MKPSPPSILVPPPRVIVILLDINPFSFGGEEASEQHPLPVPVRLRLSPCGLSAECRKTQGCQIPPATSGRRRFGFLVVVNKRGGHIVLAAFQIMVIARNWYCGRGGIVDSFGDLGLDVVGTGDRAVHVARAESRCWHIGGRACHGADNVTFTYWTCATAGCKPGGTSQLVSSGTTKSQVRVGGKLTCTLRGTHVHKVGSSLYCGHQHIPPSRLHTRFVWRYTF